MFIDKSVAGCGAAIGIKKSHCFLKSDDIPISCDRGITSALWQCPAAQRALASIWWSLMHVDAAGYDISESIFGGGNAANWLKRQWSCQGWKLTLVITSSANRQSDAVWYANWTSRCRWLCISATSSSALIAAQDLKMGRIAFNIPTR